jgi:hypothetical protein
MTLVQICRTSGRMAGRSPPAYWRRGVAPTSLDRLLSALADLSGRWIGSCGVISRAATNAAVRTDREARFFTICSSYAPILNQRREISR